MRSPHSSSATLLPAAPSCDSWQAYCQVPPGQWPAAVAGTVLAAFALELWFKALYCKVNPLGIAPTGHDLRRLFDSLEPIQKGAIGSKSGHSLADICSELQANADVFQTWRYAYEHGAGQPGPVQALEANIGLLFDLLKACEEVYALP